MDFGPNIRIYMTRESILQVRMRIKSSVGDIQLVVSHFMLATQVAMSAAIHYSESKIEWCNFRFELLYIYKLALVSLSINKVIYM